MAAIKLIVKPIPTAELTEENVSRFPLPEIPDGWDPSETKSGGHNIKSYCYYPQDEVISAAQKSVRRCWITESVYWWLEAFWAGKGATRTNTWNRALVTAMEDIGPADTDMLPAVYFLSEKYRDDPYAIAICGWEMAMSKKSRVNDWGANCQQHYMYEKDRAHGLGSPEQIMVLLVKLLREKDTTTESLNLMKALLCHEWTIGGKYKKAEYCILQAFEQVIGKDDPYLKICIKLALSANWRWQYKAYIIHLHIYNLWINDRWYLTKTYQSLIDGMEKVLESPSPELTAMVEDHWCRTMPLRGMPDIFVDKHTARGRRMKRDSEHFFEHGAHLNNIDEYWEPLSQWYFEGMMKGELE